MALSIIKQMKRDGRTLGHETLEEMRKLAVQRMNEGERPADVAASFGLHRSWAFKCRGMAKRCGNVGGMFSFIHPLHRQLAHFFQRLVPQSSSVSLHLLVDRQGHRQFQCCLLSY